MEVPMTPKPILPLCICGDPCCKILYGCCHCGCGGQTRIATKTDRKANQERGKPIKYIPEHNNRRLRKSPRYGELDGVTVAYIDCLDGDEAIVDLSDLRLISHHNWYCDQNGYAISWCVKTERTISMARLILKAPKGKQIDHKNFNRLDNRRCNIRLCTQTQNLQNRRGRSATGFKGVEKGKYGYSARIRHNGQREYLGHFKRVEMASQAYNEKALEYHGEFACLEMEDK
jgi:hypothetical protein